MFICDCGTQENLQKLYHSEAELMRNIFINNNFDDIKEKIRKMKEDYINSNKTLTLVITNPNILDKKESDFYADEDLDQDTDQLKKDITLTLCIPKAQEQLLRTVALSKIIQQINIILKVTLFILVATIIMILIRILRRRIE